jgi:hypothetical protein
LGYQVRKLGTAAVFAMTLLLCGCTDADWNNVLSFNTAQNPDAAASQSADVEAAPQPVDETAAPQPIYSQTRTATAASSAASSNPTTGYCRSIARSSGADAARDGMQSPAQQQVADAAYNQCMVFFDANAN